MARKQLDDAFLGKLRESLDTWRRGEITLQAGMDALNELKRQVPEQERFSYLGQIEQYIGILYGYTGKLDQSAKHFEAASRYFRQNHDESRLVGCELNLGETYRLVGNYTQAIRAFRISYDLSVKEGNLNGQALSLANEAIIQVDTGNYKQARNNLNRAIELALQPWETPETSPTRRLSYKCEMIYTLGLLEIEEGNLEAAWEQAKNTLEIAQTVKEPLRLGQANAIIAQVIDKYGHSPEEPYEDQPDTYFKLAISYYEKIQLERELANIHLIYGNSLAARHENSSAREHYSQAMAIFARLGLPKLAAQAAEARATLGRR